MTIYMYYGNGSAVAGSDGVNTFMFFDDFLGDSLDTGKWTDYDAGTWGTLGVSGSIATISGSSLNAVYQHMIYSNSTVDFSSGGVIEWYNNWNFSIAFSNNADEAKKAAGVSNQVPSLLTYNYTFEYQKYRSTSISYLRRYRLVYCTTTCGSTTSNASKDNPGAYEIERDLWYTGNEKGAYSTNHGDSWTNTWSKTTDPLGLGSKYVLWTVWGW